MLKIVTIHNDKRNILRQNLTTKTTSWEDMAARKMHKQMADICRTHRGVGLAANQVGVEENMFFIGPSAKMPHNMGGGLCINPSYIPDGPAMVLDTEGCLSIPGRTFPQRRYVSIIATWTNTSGKTITAKLKNYAARVFQHEYDHLCGLTLMETSDKPAV